MNTPIVPTESVLQLFRVYSKNRPTKVIKAWAHDATEAVLNVRERVPAFARASDVVAFLN